METLNKPKISKIKKVFLVIIGAFVGGVNGLLGGGGGTVLVPTYTGLADMQEKTAHATSIVSILPLCLISSIIYLTKNEFDYLTGGIVTGGVIVGGIIGSLILKKINSQVLNLVFYGLMIYAGAKMII